MRGYGLKFGLVVLVWFGVASIAQASADAAKKAIEALSEAFQQGRLLGDEKADPPGSQLGIADLISGKHGETLRKLAPPLLKAKAASDKFDALLKGKHIPFRNHLGESLIGIVGMELSLVTSEEIQAKSSDPSVYIARIRYGPRGRAQEEDVEVRFENDRWRVSPPAELARELRRYLPADGKTPSVALDRQVRALGALAAVYEAAVEAITKEKFDKPEQIQLKLMELVRTYRLKEILDGTDDPAK